MFSLAALWLPSFPSNPSTPIFTPQPYTHAHFGNITFLKFSFEFKVGTPPGQT